MSLPLQTSRFGVIAFLVGAFVGCGSHPPDADDGGLGTGGSAGGAGATGGTGGASSTGAGGSGGSGATGGATGGSSGTSGTGGSGGTTGSGGTGTGGAGGTRPCECSTAVVRWWMDGGLAFLRDVSELHPCQTFVLTREAMATPPGTRACKQELDCASAISASDVNVAVAHPDVQRAIAAGHVLYGEDPRPVDGQVMAIDIGARIEIGPPCRTPTCNPIPAGVDALGNLLTALTKQELALGYCRMTFPPVP